VKYGCGDANLHNYGRSSKTSFWIWNHTPSLTHGLIPAPSEGLSGSGHSECAISIWWGWFNEKTGLPELGSATDGIVVTDSDERIVIPRILPQMNYVRCSLAIRPEIHDVCASRFLSMDTLLNSRSPIPRFHHLLTIFDNSYRGTTGARKTAGV
jgi:hypothetical protein